MDQRSEFSCHHDVGGVRSTAADGSSTIVPRVDVVSTARSSIGIVVTEHGIVDLRPLSDEQRRTALIGIAHPSHRQLAGRQLLKSGDRCRAAIAGQ
jgi:acyl-CoA hydrolase